ncbi:MAG: hypothetical protein L6455_03290, partial [Kiritimatiellae bacterium]|nr:hypothetical protein [Kiritimatiellia bacterium]
MNFPSRYLVCFTGILKVPSLAFAIWLGVSVPSGFTDPFPDRPAQTGLEAAVTLGTDCGLGVYERSLAVQVAPPAITNGWCLDQNTMAGLDTQIKALVTNYVDTNSVYNGSSNIVLLTVPGLWASLEIG